MEWKFKKKINKKKNKKSKLNNEVNVIKMDFRYFLTRETF